MPQTPLYMFVVVLSLGGFILAFYLHHHKRRATEPLVCPLKGHCDTVIHSDYSKLMGIPVENLGMLYYALTAISYALVIVFPNLYVPMVASSLMGMSLLAFMFSIYLTMIQALVLKNWCTWCLISAFLCLSIFSIVATNSPFLAPLFSSIILSL